MAWRLTCSISASLPMNPEASPVVGIVAHDAGGAEILASYAAQNELDARYALAGPAIDVFRRKLGDVPITSVERLLEEADWLLCGTSWQSDSEWQATRLARAAGKKAVSFLDHWVNYVQRYVRDGETVLPDEIWVGDPYARTLAEELFPDTPVSLVNNPAYKDVEKACAEARKGREPASGTRLLFVSDNIEESLNQQYGDGNHWGYTDRDSLRYLLAHLDRLGVKVDRVTVRPHPSEPSGRFAWALEEFAPLVVMSSGGTLIDELVEHDIVVGSESMAMVIALLCGKRVVCSIPPAGKACALPHSEIEMLRDVAGQL